MSLKKKTVRTLTVLLVSLLIACLVIDRNQKSNGKKVTILAGQKMRREMINQTESGHQEIVSRWASVFFAFSFLLGCSLCLIQCTSPPSTPGGQARPDSRPFQSDSISAKNKAPHIEKAEEKSPIVTKADSAIKVLKSDTALKQKSEVKRGTADSIVKKTVLTHDSLSSDSLTQVVQDTIVPDSTVKQKENKKKKVYMPLVCTANPGSIEGAGMRGEYLLQGDVKCDYGRLHFETSNAIWDRLSNEVTCNGGMKVLVNGLVLTSETGGYNQRTSLIWARENVHGIDTSGTYEFASGYLTYDRETHEMNLLTNPVLRKFYKNDSLIIGGVSKRRIRRVDTLSIRGKKIRYNDSLRIAFASPDVHINRGHLDIVCSSATFYEKTQKIEFTGNPVAKLSDSEMKGDLMYLTLDGEKVTSLSLKGEAIADYQERKKSIEKDIYHLKGDSMYMKIDEEKMDFIELLKDGLASHVTTTDTGKVNEMTGGFLRINFKEGKMDSALVKRNANSVFFYYDKDEYKGKNISSGDTITIVFNEGKVDDIKIQGQVKGTYLGQPAKKKLLKSPKIDSTQAQADPEKGLNNLPDSKERE
ncbi:MAG: hypothetical protein HQK83_09685 [Fibrobacteria bacterium]|nr:hypothetical protein [Fibrobacteria bacterium]